MWANIPRIDSLRALPIVFCEAYRNDDNWAPRAWNWMALDQLEEKSPGLGKRKKTSCYKSPNWWIPLEFWGQNPQDVQYPFFIYGRSQNGPYSPNSPKWLQQTHLLSWSCFVNSNITRSPPRPGWYDSLGCSFTRHLTLTYVVAAYCGKKQVFQSNSDIGRCWHFTLACKLQEKDDRVNSHIWQENLMKAWIVHWPLRLPKDSEVQHIQKTSIAIPFVV